MEIRRVLVLLICSTFCLAYFPQEEHPNGDTLLSCFLSAEVVTTDPVESSFTDSDMLSCEKRRNLKTSRGKQKSKKTERIQGGRSGVNRQSTVVQVNRKKTKSTTPAVPKRNRQTEKQQCSDGYFKCPRSYCVPNHHVCDGRVHCPDGTDEMNCSSLQGIQNIFIHFFGLDSDKVEAAGNLAAQLYRKELNIQIFSVVKTIIKANSDPPMSRYLIRTHTVTSVIPLIKRFQEEYNVSLDNFETDMNEVLRHDNTSETMSIFLQNRQLTEEEETILNRTNTAISSQFSFRVERDETLNKELQMPLSQSSPSKYVRIKNWKILRSGGSLLFQRTFNGDPTCRNAFRCSFSHVCISLWQVCDNKQQCPHGDDEELCDFKCPNNCTCEGYKAICPGLSYNVFNLLSSTTRTLDATYCTGLNGTLDIRQNFFFLIELNISFSNIKSISMESFSQTKNLLKLDLSYNLLTVIQANLFNKLKYLRMLLLLGNELISVIEPVAFNGLTVKQITVSHTKLKVIYKDNFNGLNLTRLDLSHNLIETVEDFAFERLTVNQLDMTFNPIKNFGKAMFKGLLGLKRLKTPMYKFCCMRPIYLEEKNCFPHRDEFSSCGDLMRRTSLQFLLWIIGLLAISGNIFSIVFRVFFDKKRLKMVYGIFVVNLAASDLLMGIYMTIIAIADTVYRNRYIEEDEYWRKSAWCSLAGILSTVSSEASVLFICLITVDRLLVIKYPFGSVRISTNLAKAMVIFCWSVCLLIAILPVVQSHYFGDQFYSKSAVCLALPLTKDRSAGWMYSIVIFIGFNFITFIMIALGQAMIYYEVRHQSSVMKKKSSARRNDLKVARNLLLLVTTDFACWFPIGCMGLMSVNGYTIPGEVYAWTAVLVLPINSAINPFLYTLMAVINSKKFNPSINEQQTMSKYIKGKRKGFLQAYYGMWFPDSKIEFDIFSPASDVVSELKPGDLLWIFADIFKSLHLHHSHGLFYKDINAENVLIYLPSNRKYGGIRIKQKPTEFSKNTQPKQDICMIGEILRPLAKC